MFPEAAAAAPAQSQTAEPIAPAAPESAAAPVVEQDFVPLEELVPGSDDYQTWNKTGNLPKRVAKPAEAAPAAEAETVDPAIARFIRTPKPEGISRRQHERNELIRFATEQEQRLQALERQWGGKPAPQPVAPPAQPQAPAKDYDGIDPSDPEPSIDQFAEAADPYYGFMRAHLKWEDRKDARVAQFKTSAERHSLEIKQRVDAFQQRRVAFAATTPDFEAKTAPFLNYLDQQGGVRTSPQQPSTPVTDITEFIADSEVGPQLALHLAAHPDEFNRIVQSNSPQAVHRALARLETSLTAAPAPAQPSAPTPKTVSSAPPPPSFLGTRPAEPADGVASAVDRGDFSAYDNEQTQRDLARFGGRR